MHTHPSIIWAWAVAVCELVGQGRQLRSSVLYVFSIHAVGEESHIWLVEYKRTAVAVLGWYLFMHIQYCKTCILNVYCCLEALMSTEMIVL